MCMCCLTRVSPTHSLLGKVSPKWEKGVKVVEKGFVIGTPMGNMVETNNVYVGVGVSLAGYKT